VHLTAAHHRAQRITEELEMATTKTRALLCQGWMGKTCTVTVTGGTLKEAKREARATAAGLLPYAGRVTVVAVTEL